MQRRLSDPLVKTGSDPWGTLGQTLIVNFRARKVPCLTQNLATELLGDRLNNSSFLFFSGSLLA